MGQARSSRAFSIFHCIFVSSFYWAFLLTYTTTGSKILFPTAVFKRIQRAPALLYGLRSKRLLRPRASAVPGATTTASTLPRQWRPAGRLDLSPRPALLLVLQSCFQLRSLSVPSVPPCTTLRSALQKVTSATSITCSRSDHYCFYIPSPVACVLLDTGLVSSPCTTTGSKILFPTAVFKRIQRAPVHCSTDCSPKGYFDHEHHLFQERPLLLLHSLASGVRPAGTLDLSPRPALLLVLKSCFQLRSSSVSSVPPCTALRTALQKATSTTSITCSRSDHYCFYIPSPVASCW
ncbi:uncharacterized protein [Dermacentor albipictus]|uniref:uncharacterized protein isoform X2 n=1 Tax=Dermacentor albipictus TaxID=60249 RepID=UPI0031FCE27E